MSKKQKAIIYVRTASGGQHQPKQCPLKVQEQKCRRYCKQQGLEVIKTFKEVSLSRLSKQPELLKAIVYCEENNISFIVADNFCRFSRKAENYDMLKRMCGTKIRLQTIVNPVDNPAENRFQEAIHLRLATYEYETQRKRSMLGQKCMCQSR